MNLNRGLFQKLANVRLSDAKALLRLKRFDAAYYVAGYAVECALKACICKNIKRYDFPPRQTDHYSHDFEKLLSVAKIALQFESDRKTDSDLAKYWVTVKDWKPDSRYDRRGRKAAADLVRAIADEHHGVLQCLSKYW